MFRGLATGEAAESSGEFQGEVNRGVGGGECGAGKAGRAGELANNQSEAAFECAQRLGGVLALAVGFEGEIAGPDEELDGHCEIGVADVGGC